MRGKKSLESNQNLRSEFFHENLILRAETDFNEFSKKKISVKLFFLKKKLNDKRGIKKLIKSASMDIIKNDPEIIFFRGVQFFFSSKGLKPEQQIMSS